MADSRLVVDSDRRRSLADRLAFAVAAVAVDCSCSIVAAVVGWVPSFSFDSDCLDGVVVPFVALALADDSCPVLVHLALDSSRFAIDCHWPSDCWTVCPPLV